MTDLWADLLSCLNLRSCDGGGFEGPNQQLEYHRLFGRQILGQLVRAACVSCPDKIIKSLHAVFAREGRADEPVRYEVTAHHNFSCGCEPRPLTAIWRWPPTRPT